MYLSFEGVRINALRKLRDIKHVASENKHEDDLPDTWAIECAISAYHDCLLGVLSGKVGMDEIKEFLLHGKTDEQIKAMPFCGDVVSFKEAQ